MKKEKEPPKPLEVGDAVYLKSGSQRMTVVEITDGTAKVVWMNYGGDGLIKEGTVPAVALTRAKPYGE